MTGLSRSQSERKQWDWDLQRRDPDSKELTKLGLEMTGTRKPGDVYSEDTCRGFSLWQPGTVQLMDRICSQLNPSNRCLQHVLTLPLALLAITFKSRCFYYYYFQCNYNKCWKSNWTNASSSANDSYFFFSSDGLLFLFFSFFFICPWNCWSSSGGTMEDLIAWNCISYFLSPEGSL